jgi:predicted permease
MALSTALLVGAALLVRSIIHLQSIDPGFQSAGLYSIAPRLPQANYPDPAAAARYFNQLTERAKSVPGVDAITVAAGAPPSNSFMIGSLQLDGEAPPPAGTSSFVNYNGITPDYFKVMQIGLVQGTTFTDTSSAAAQVIINEGFAHARYPGVSPLGKRLRVVFNGSGDWKTIVGVVKNAATGGLLMESSAPILYMPSANNYSPGAILRISRPEVALPALRRILSEIDPRVPPVDIVNVDDAMKSSIAGPRFTMALIASFTALAVLLAAIGLYGLVSYAVTQRTREIGIRIALGATRQRIARAVLAQGFTLGLVGLAVGLVAARLGVKLIAHQLNGISATDPVSFTAAGLALLATVLLACLIPMARAIAVPPQIAMQAE